MLAGVLGGMNAIAAWLIILACVIAGVLIRGFYIWASIEGRTVTNAVRVRAYSRRCVCDRITLRAKAVLFVIMKQGRYQSWALRQLLNREVRMIELLEAQTWIKRVDDPTRN